MNSALEWSTDARYHAVCDCLIDSSREKEWHREGERIITDREEKNRCLAPPKCSRCSPLSYHCMCVHFVCVCVKLYNLKIPPKTMPLLISLHGTQKKRKRAPVARRRLETEAIREWKEKKFVDKNTWTFPLPCRMLEKAKYTIDWEPSRMR